MVNLNAKAYYPDHEYLSSAADDCAAAGGTRGDALCNPILGYGDGGSVGKPSPYSRRLSFQPRYGNLLHPDYAFLYPSPGGAEPQPSQSDAGCVRGILTRTNDNNSNRMPPASCARPSYTCPSVKLCLCEDVLQRSPPRTHWSADCATVAAKSPSTMPKRIVSEVVTSCCLGVAPESDVASSMCGAETPTTPAVTTQDKAVMTDEVYPLTNGPVLPSAQVAQTAPRTSRSQASTAPHTSCPPASTTSTAPRTSCSQASTVPTAPHTSCSQASNVPSAPRTSRPQTSIAPRNSCPLSPPADDLCECEKRVLSQNADGGAGRLVYRNGDEVPQPAVASVPQALLEKALLFNERYCRDQVETILRSRAPVPNSVSKGSDGSGSSSDSSDSPPHSSCERRSGTSVAECAKCGSLFEVRAGTYFSGPTLENLTSSSAETTSSGEAGSSSGSSSGKSRTHSADKDRELTAEERETILRKLEEIVSGDLFDVTAPRNVQPPSFTSSMLHLDLNAFRGDSDSDSSTAQRPFSNVDAECRFGRVAELTRLFSRLGEAGIIKSRSQAKSTPNIVGADDDDDSMNVCAMRRRSISVEEMGGRGVELHEMDSDDPSKEVALVSKAQDRPSECFKRRQSFARQNSGFCKMGCVDELDQKRRRRQKSAGLHKYASVSDFRLLVPKRQLCDGVDLRTPSKVVSFDDLDVKKWDAFGEPELRINNVTVDPLQPHRPGAVSPPPDDEALNVDFERVTTAIRNYLTNRELLLKRMKSNSADSVAGDVCATNAPRRACSESVLADEKKCDGEGRPLKCGKSLHAIPETPDDPTEHKGQCGGWRRAPSN